MEYGEKAVENGTNDTFGKCSENGTTSLQATCGLHDGVVQHHDLRVYSSRLSIYAVLLFCQENLVNLAREEMSQSDTR